MYEWLDILSSERLLCDSAPQELWMEKNYPTIGTFLIKIVKCVTRG